MSHNYKEVTWQRCFQVQKPNLDQFLIQLDMQSNVGRVYQAEFIFKNETHYDVVVMEKGDNPSTFHREEIVNFNFKLHNTHKKRDDIKDLIYKLEVELIRLSGVNKPLMEITLDKVAFKFVSEYMSKGENRVSYYYSSNTGVHQHDSFKFRGIMIKREES